MCTPRTAVDEARRVRNAQSLCNAALTPLADDGRGIYKWLWREEGGSEPPEAYCIHSDDGEPSAQVIGNVSEQQQQQQQQQPHATRESLLVTLRNALSESSRGPRAHAANTAGTSRKPRPHASTQPRPGTSRVGNHLRSSSFPAAAEPTRVTDAMRRLIQTPAAGPLHTEQRGRLRVSERA